MTAPNGRGILGLLSSDPRPLRIGDVGEHPMSWFVLPERVPGRGVLRVLVRRHTDEEAHATRNAEGMTKCGEHTGEAGVRRRLAAPLARRPRRLIAAIDLVVAANAVGGMGYALAGAEAVPAEWLERGPFNSYRIPGLYLGTVVGGTSLLAAWAAACEDRRARPAAVASAAVMITWIAAQLAIIGYRSPLQPAIVATGAAVGYLALKD